MSNDFLFWPRAKKFYKVETTSLCDIFAEELLQFQFSMSKHWLCLSNFIWNKPELDNKFTNRFIVLNELYIVSQVELNWFEHTAIGSLSLDIFSWLPVYILSIACYAGRYKDKSKLTISFECLPFQDSEWKVTNWIRMLQWNYFLVVLWVRFEIRRWDSIGGVHR